MGLVLERIMRSFRGAPPGTTLTVTIALTILLIGVVQYTLQSDGEAQTPHLPVRRQQGVDPRRQPPLGRRALLRGGRRRGRRAALPPARPPAPASPCGPSSTTPTWPASPARRRSRSPGPAGSSARCSPPLAGVLYAPTAGKLDAVNLTFFVLAAYGAAVFGRLRSLPLTFAGAIMLGLVQGYAPIAFPTSELWNHLQVGVPGRLPLPRAAGPARGQAQRGPRGRARHAAGAEPPRHPRAGGALRPGGRPPGQRGRRQPPRPHPGARLRHARCSRSSCSPATRARSRWPSTCSSASARSRWARWRAATASSAWARRRPSRCRSGW